MFKEITRADIQKIRQAMAKADEAEQKTAIMKACDIPCDDLADRCMVQKNFCVKFLQNLSHLAPENR